MKKFGSKIYVLLIDIFTVIHVFFQINIGWSLFYVGYSNFNIYFLQYAISILIFNNGLYISIVTTHNILIYGDVVSVDKEINTYVNQYTE